MLRSAVGQARAASGNTAASDASIEAAIEKAVERHGAAWETNQIAAWDTLSAAELEKMCDAMADDDRLTMMSLTTRVAGAARQHNEPLLRRAAAEVLAELQ